MCSLANPKPLADQALHVHHHKQQCRCVTCRMIGSKLRRSEVSCGVAPQPHLEALVDQALLVEGAEHPPHAFHEAGVQSLVVILKVNPAPNALHCLLPLLGIPAPKRICRVDCISDYLTVYHIHAKPVNNSLYAVLRGLKLACWQAVQHLPVHTACARHSSQQADVIPHDNAATLLIVLVNAHLEDILLGVNVCSKAGSGCMQ